MTFTRETIFNAAIIICGVIVLVAFISYYIKLSTIIEGIANCKITTTKNSKRAGKNSTQSETITSTRTDFVKVNEQREIYNKMVPAINMVIQFISLFPMAGLLGTVYGLRNTMQGSDMDFSMIGLALSTTLWGLGCAMILKLVATMSVIKKMEIIEINLYEADREHDMLIKEEKFDNMDSESTGE